MRRNSQLLASDIYKPYDTANVQTIFKPTNKKEKKWKNLKY